MATGTLRLYLDAARSARARQLRARVTRPLGRRRSGRRPTGALGRVAGADALWRSDAFAGAGVVAARLGDGEVETLGARVPYPGAFARPGGLDRLRGFHLHYGDEILGAARYGDPARLEQARAGLAAWIDACPPHRGDAWHPYPLSTRVGNWVAALSLEPALASDAVVESLRCQLAFLRRNVENDVLGNHVIRNARALALGGAAFGDRALVRFALDLLRRELPEQVLPDGGHYERSPVYHLIVLRDLLEVRAATSADELDEPIERMSRFAAALARPDGAPALFNDGGLDVAPDLRGFLPEPKDGMTVFEETGYAIVRGSTLWLAFDCGPLAPPFLPAHAHADALSFQLWLGSAPLVVDPGSYAYDGPARDWYRSTPAHSTVAVDGASQCAFWGPFRASLLPRVKLGAATGDARAGRLEAVVEGFPAVRHGIRHVRSVSWDEHAVRVDDEVHGAGRHRVSSSLPLAPSASADSVEADCAGGDVRTETRSVAERFYDSVESLALVCEQNGELPRASGWRIRMAVGGPGTR